MKQFRTGLILALGLGLSACGAIDTATRNAPMDMPQMAVSAPSVQVQSYNIKVSRGLRVSEANLYYPMGDIVWRGEPMGDRHAQVAGIFENSIKQVQQESIIDVVI